MNLYNRIEPYDEQHLCPSSQLLARPKKIQVNAECSVHVSKTLRNELMKTKNIRLKTNRGFLRYAIQWYKFAFSRKRQKRCAK